MKRIIFQRMGAVMVGGIISGALVSLSVRANDTTKFTWTVPVGTCSVSIDTPQLDLGNVDITPAVGQNWKALNQKPFKVNLSSCAGVADSGLRPVVIVSGTTITTPNASTFIFKTEGTSVGFGFVLLKSVKEAGNNGTDLEATNNEQLYVPKTGGASWYGLGETLNGGYSIPLTAAVTCGRTAWCATSALKAGSLKAKVSFTFAYK